MFHLILFGESIVYFNLYLQAFCQLGMIGIGKNKSRFQIAEVRNTEGEKVVAGDKVDMRNYKICMLNNYIAKRKEELGFSEGRYTLIFTTPLSMRYQKKYMDQFYSEALLQGVARRIQMLNYFIGREAKLPVFTQYPVIRSQFIKKKSMKRYSSTHDARTELWGISGRCDGKITVLHWKRRLIPEALQEDYLYVIQQYLFCRLLFTASLEGESLREISKKPFIKLEK